MKTTKLDISILFYMIVGFILFFCNIGLFANQKKNGNRFITVEGNRFFLNNQAFIMKGFNYYPRNYCWSSMAAWDSSEVYEELSLGKALGANVIRTFIDYGFSTDSTGFGDYDDSLKVVSNCHPTDQYKQAMKTFLNVAEKNDLKVIFTLFDYMPEWALVDRFDQYEGAVHIYLNELLSDFVGDPRIAAWDLLNDGDRLADEEDNENTEFDDVMEFYKNVSGIVKSIDPNHLVTAGFSKIDTAHLSYDFVDYISFHYYMDQGCFGMKIQKLQERLDHFIMNKPIVVDEFGFPSAGDPGASLSEHTVRMGSYLDIILNDYQLNGALFWNLTDFNDPKTDFNRLVSPFPDSLDHELYRGIYDVNLKEKPSVELVQKYFTNQYGIWNRLDFKYNKVRNGIDLDPDDQRHFAIAFHDKIEFLGQDSSVIVSIPFDDIWTINPMQGRGWYKSEDWSDYHGYWGQWAGNLDRVSSMYLTPPQNTHFLKLRLQADSAETELIVFMSHVPLDTLMLNQDIVDGILPFRTNMPPEIISPKSVKACRDSTFRYTAVAVDPEGSTITYRFEAYPQWLKPSDSTIEGMPLKGCTDTSFVVIASDGVAFDSLTVEIQFIETYVDQNDQVIFSYFLFQNYPNPFNPRTTITFVLPYPGHVNLTVYNVQGQEVNTLMNAACQAGSHTVIWDGRDVTGKSVGNGVYFCVLKADDHIKTRRMVLIR